MNKTIEKLIEDSLRELKKVWNEEEHKSRLIIPTKSKKEKRLSEQEARFLFVRELEKTDQKEYFYSVETPTKKFYKGFSIGQPKIAKKGGRPGSIDVTLSDSSKKQYCMIEFKQGNTKTCKKDFLKLAYDMDGLINYYINIIDRANLLETENTFKSIRDKYKDAINELKDENKDCKEHSILRIFLFNVNDGELIVFEDIDLKNNLEIEVKPKESKHLL